MLKSVMSSCCFFFGSLKRFLHRRVARLLLSSFDHLNWFESISFFNESLKKWFSVMSVTFGDVRVEVLFYFTCI